MPVARKKQLRQLLKANRRTLKDLAKALGVHPSAPGKWLVAETEPLPEARRSQLLALGLPEELLPAPLIPLCRDPSREPNTLA